MADPIQWDDFSQRLPYRNLALLVEDRKFWIPRDMMADFSPVFAAMLYGEFSEATKNEIPLIYKRAEDILEMLRVLIPTNGRKKRFDYENVALLSKLADEYQIKYLELKCKDFLESPSIVEGKDGIKTLFLDGVKYGQKEIVRLCLPLFARFESTELQSILNDLPDQVRSAVLYQIIGQSKSHLSACHYNVCQCSDDGRRYLAQRFIKCHACDKFTVLNRDLDLAAQICCRCIDSLAATELEKIGL